MSLEDLLELRGECDNCERPIRSEAGRDHCAACIMEQTVGGSADA